MFRVRSVLYSFLVIFFLSSCASLPPVNDIIYGPLNFRSPSMAGPRGELTPAQSKRIWERLARDSGSRDLLTRQTLVIEELTGRPLIVGNKVTLLISGEVTYKAMTKAIRAARDHINFETFIFEDDEVGRRFADLLIEKQREGVQVNLIYDSAGSFNTPAAFFQELMSYGINVAQFNPVNPLKAKKADFLTHRDHRKILVIDGKIAFTGGVNISAVYSSSPSGAKVKGEPWRDTDIQVEGPAVAEFQRLFIDTWNRQKAPELAERNYFPKLDQKGNDLIQLVGSTPGERNRDTYVMYVSAITFAQKSIHLTNAYFVPDEQTVRALMDAAQRGLDVRIILPSTSDSSLVFWAGRSYYSELLESGVRLYERGGGMLHAKTAVIDSVWSTVGSSNFDLWSFARNDEVNTVILGHDFAAEMEAMFAADLKASEEMTPEKWKSRPLPGRIRELFSRLISYWL